VISYLVCATPRSGSTLLCETLAETGVAGDPEEFFEAVPATGVPRRPLDYLEGLDDAAALALIERAPPHPAPPYSDLRTVGSYAEHLERVREWGTTPNGVFGAKIMWAHLEDLARQLDSHDLSALVDEVFDRPRLVWVRRADTVRQAVSLWRAMQTQSWRAENEHDAGEPRYSFAALRHLVELLTAHDAAWERFFAAKRADVLTVGYDDLSTDLAGVLARTLDHIGVAAPDGALDALPRLRRQADQRSDAWAAAYARDAVLASR
jgi:LPS sulfotransferase NodH